MQEIKYPCWQDDSFVLGILDDYPDYMAQAFDEQELIEILRSLLKDIMSGEIPFVP